MTKLSRILAGQDTALIAIGAVIGTLTGLGALGFAWVLTWFEDEVSVFFHDGAWGPHWLWLVVVPMIGMGLSGVLIYFFASEAKGHGVPQVMAALIRRGGVIPLRIGVVKLAASVLTVGSGGSAGTEGPIVQIGAVVGSVVGQRLHMDRQRMMTFVGCGAAAGISSIFNAPIAGVFFVLEILLRDFSVRTFTPIVVSSVFSAITTQAFSESNSAIFAVSGTLHGPKFEIIELPGFLLLGGVCGLVAVGFTRTLHAFEDVYEAVKIHPILKPLTGAFLLGLLGIGFLSLAGVYKASGEVGGYPAIYGNGYSVIRSLLDPETYTSGTEAVLPVSVLLMASLVVFKCLATSLTLASGGSGGVFAPSLFLGAGTGAMIGAGLHALNLVPAGTTPASYALVGMAAVVAATTHAPLTAILILFEITQDYRVVLPIMLAAVLSTVVSQLIDRDSIYTAKLRRAGVLIGTSRDLVLLRRIPVSSVPRTALPPEPIYASDPLSKLITLHAHYHVPDFVVVDEQGRYIGMVTGADIRTALIDREAIPLLLVAELVRSDLPTVAAHESLDVVLDRFAENDVASLCLLDPASPDKPLALLSRAKVMKRYQEALEESV
jgi:CIC family chloride channel protein